MTERYAGRRQIVAIVGRTNVGKSTLFNALTRSRSALVAAVAGLTRDRQYGLVRNAKSPFVVVDTGGLQDHSDRLSTQISAQAQVAIDEADLLLFVLDAHDLLSVHEDEIAHTLRVRNKPVLLVINKVDGSIPDGLIEEALRFGLGAPLLIAAAHNRGIRSLIEQIEQRLPPSSGVPMADPDGALVKLAIVGRPNVGKSTLVNALLGEERVLASPIAGTTRDAIELPFDYQGERYCLVDTAGVRRKARVQQSIEKFSVIKTLQAIESAQLTILMLDATTGVVEQDLHLLGHIIDTGRAVVMAANKWDCISAGQRQDFARDWARECGFADYVERVPLSATQAWGFGKLMKAVRRAHASAGQRWSTHDLTELLARAQRQHQPPLVRGRRIKLKHAHFGGDRPPTVVIHGGQAQRVPGSYQRYLANYFRSHLRLVGTPLRLEFRRPPNPYGDTAKGRRQTRRSLS